MSPGEDMETYEAVYKELLAAPVPREGQALQRGGVPKIVRFTPPPNEDEPYERLVRELREIPFRWLV
jgi:hypothetical protein